MICTCLKPNKMYHVVDSALGVLFGYHNWVSVCLSDYLIAHIFVQIQFFLHKNVLNRKKDLIADYNRD